MSGTFLKSALVLSAIVAAFIIATAGTASSATAKQCSDAYNKCMDGCDKISGSRADGSDFAKCTGKCGLRLVNCSPWKLPSSSGSMQTPTGTTQTPPKGKVGMDPVNVGGIKDPGSGSSSSPKGKVGLESVDVGGAKQLGGTSDAGTTIYQSGGRKKH